MSRKKIKKPDPVTAKLEKEVLERDWNHYVRGTDNQNSTAPQDTAFWSATAFWVAGLGLVGVASWVTAVWVFNKVFH